MDENITELSCMFDDILVVMDSVVDSELSDLTPYTPTVNLGILTVVPDVDSQCIRTMPILSPNGPLSLSPDHVSVGIDTSSDSTERWNCCLAL